MSCKWPTYGNIAPSAPALPSHFKSLLNAPWTTHMRGSFSWRSWRGTKNFSTAPGLPIPSRPLLFLYRLAHVHQEDRSSNLARSRPLLRTCYPSAHSERAIQVHTQECVIQVHTQERAIQVHTQNMLSTCTLITCYPSHGILVYYSCTTNLVHLLYLCTSCTSLRCF